MKVRDVRVNKGTPACWNRGDTAIDSEGDVWLCMGDREGWVLLTSRVGVSPGLVVTVDDGSLNLRPCNCELVVTD